MSYSSSREAAFRLKAGGILSQCWFCHVAVRRTRSFGVTQCVLADVIALDVESVVDGCMWLSGRQWDRKRDAA